jgi:steroid delta-isomerase-like uncharacterized protein
MSVAILEAYYDAFNAGDHDTMLALLAEDVVHEPSQGEPRLGKAAFRDFLAHMDRCYSETVIDPVFLSSPDGARLAAEFYLTGAYRVTDGDLPPANGQRYRLRVGAFFEVRDGRIGRVSNHYNLADWTAQVSADASD